MPTTHGGQPEYVCILTQVHTTNQVSPFISPHNSTLPIESESRLILSLPYIFLLMASKVTLVCWVLGYDSTFVVDINPDNLIGHLKQAVVESFHGTSVHQLLLCIANIPDTIEELQNFKFEDHEVLRGSAKISKVFQSRPVYMLPSSFLVSNTHLFQLCIFANCTVTPPGSRI